MMNLFCDKLKNIFSPKTWIAIAILGVLKLYFVSIQHMHAIGKATYDDRLFINIANNLLRGTWLGKYDSLTLAKGSFYPMWIAVTNLLHLPLLFSEQLLYVLASIATIIALRPVLKKNWQFLVVYIFVLFNPMSFTDGPATRVMREGIYQPLTLLFAALFIGLVLRIKYPVKNIAAWSIGSGLALSAFWLTREEGIWIMPFAALAIIYAIYTTWREKLNFHKLIFLVLPFALLGVSVFIVSFINYRNYGIFDTVEFKAPQFLNAYGALIRVKDDHWLPDVPVSTAKRMKIYAVSPTFALLEPYLEGSTGGRWTRTSSANVNSFDINEIRGGWFMWAFREAVGRAGYYRDGGSTMKFYQQMADEINTACSEKKLDCFPPRSSMNPPWNSAYGKPFLVSIFAGTNYAIRLDGFNAIPSESDGTKKSLRIFKEATNEDPSGSNAGFRMSILTADGNFYKLILPFLAILALIIFIGTVFNKKNLENKLWIVSLLLLSLVSVRMVLLAVINVTSFPAINTLYLSPIYPIILLFVILNLIPLISFLAKKIPSRKSQ